MSGALNIETDPDVTAEGHPFVNLHVFRASLSFMVSLQRAGLDALVDDLEAQALADQGWVQMCFLDRGVEARAILSVDQALDMAKRLKAAFQQAVRHAALLAPLRAVQARQ
jgi:hypothetical protein